MRNEENGFWALAPDAQKFEAHFIAGHCVEGGKWFVHQQNLRVEQQGTRDCNALLHAARELVNGGVCEPVEADEGDQLASAVLVIAIDPAVFVLEWECDVTQDVEPRQKRRSLEDNSDFVARCGDRCTVDLDTSAGRLDQSRHQAKQS